MGDASAARRIVVCGPPLCGKTTMLTVWADSQGAQVERANATGGSESKPHAVRRVPILGSRVELVTIPGAVWTVDTWWDYLTDSVAVVLMLDSQAVRERADQEHIAVLATAPTCPRVGCVVWTKDDLVTTHGLERVKVSVPSVVNSEELWRGNPNGQSHGPLLANWPTFETRIDDRESMLAPIAFLISELSKE